MGVKAYQQFRWLSHGAPSLLGFERMKRDYSIIGEEFGDLRVLSFEEATKRSPKAGVRTFWRCLCLVCGNECVVERNNLVSGNTSSCGCQWGLREKVAWLVGCHKTTVSAVLMGQRKKCSFKSGQIHRELADRILEVSKLVGVKGKRYSDPNKRSIS